MQVIVHGGAGSRPDDAEGHDRGLSRAIDAARAESTPIDAIEAAVRVLEADPAFNAGLGGAIQADGVVRTDAGVMVDATDDELSRTTAGEGDLTTADTRSGAACSMPGVRHAVSVARLVSVETPHVLLAGESAVDLAESFGAETGADLTTERTRSRWAAAAPPEGERRERLQWVREHFGTDGNRDHDTVGAVARDGDRIAAGTSSGGRWFAHPGRVGDVPQVGAGFYASAAGAASATGHGEAIAEDGLARRTVALIEDGHGAGAATDTAIERFAAETGATAGVIAIDDGGRVGHAHNATAMGIATEQS
jgi:isoaspartyl peptidase/L-asparaginase-like protein (Ntn-hydrolase superfamily)